MQATATLPQTLLVERVAANKHDELLAVRLEIGVVVDFWVRAVAGAVEVA
jgi:hypothetical protein